MVVSASPSLFPSVFCCLCVLAVSLVLSLCCLSCFHVCVCVLSFCCWSHARSLDLFWLFYILQKDFATPSCPLALNKENFAEVTQRTSYTLKVIKFLIKTFRSTQYRLQQSFAYSFVLACSVKSYRPFLGFQTPRLSK